MFRCTVVINITNGFGTTVENKIEGSNIPKMIEDQSNGLAEIIDYNKWWDSGYFSHDLYLEYDIKIDCSKAVLLLHAAKTTSNPFVKKFLYSIP